MLRRLSPRVRLSPILRRVRAIVATASLVVCAATAGAETPLLMPVFLQQAGPKAIQIEVAAGRVGPCDSGYNVPLFRGWVDPGRTLRLASPYGCVCYRQTYDDFPQVNWSPSTVTCRRICTVQGGYGLCPADPNDALFISVRSSAR